ncbi:MAG: cohesin domain-containing protein [Burkholderiaceae bacterium]
MASCSQQRIRDSASEQIRNADYEAAIKGLQDGVSKYPESALLRAGLVQAKSDAITRLIAQAVQERTDGRFDQADKTLARVMKLDPDNARLAALKLEFEQTRRVQKALDDARNLLAQGNKSVALRVITAALRDAPRNSDLLALQRQLELDQRLASGSSRGLAETRPISLDFRNATVGTLLEAITRGSSINFMLDRDVRLDGRVTIYMKSGKVEDALDMILSANQLTKRVVDPQTVLIYPNTPDKVREHQELVIRVFHLAHVEAKTTAQMLRNLLKLKEPYVDEKANMLALREPPDVIALAERLVALHDVAQAEVMLDVEVLEVRTARLTELGVNFPNGFSLTPLGAAGSSGLTVDSLRDINSSRVGVSVGSILVNLRREVGDFNTLANPKIRTRSKEKARILIGDKVPVITTTNSGAGGLVSENVSYLDVGLKLDVEPTVSPDDEVSIAITLEVSSVVREITSAGGSTAFQIGTRNANTVLRLRDGETQILGGLISNDDRSAANRVPGLGDLPVAGRLFSSQRDEFQRTELILAITPRILRPAPRPDIAQAELWIGSEANVRLRAAPQALPLEQSRLTTAVVGTAVGVVTASTAAPAATASSAGRSPALIPNALPANVQLLWTAPTEVKVGDSFNVTVTAASGTALRGLPVEMLFSSAQLEVVSIAEGGFLKQGNSNTSFVQAVNATAGRINVGLVRNEGEGAIGEGTLFTIQFKARAAGAAQLSFSSVRPLGTAGTVATQPLPMASITVK